MPNELHALQWVAARGTEQPTRQACGVGDGAKQTLGEPGQRLEIEAAQRKDLGCLANGTERLSVARGARGENEKELLATRLGDERCELARRCFVELVEVVDADDERQGTR